MEVNCVVILSCLAISAPASVSQDLKQDSSLRPRQDKSLDHNYSEFLPFSGEVLQAEPGVHGLREVGCCASNRRVPVSVQIKAVELFVTPR